MAYVCVGLQACVQLAIGLADELDLPHSARPQKFLVSVLPLLVL
jgi:hypothetical protein